VLTAGVPFDERGGVLRGCLDLLSGRFPWFVFGGRVGRDLLPVFHFHEVSVQQLEPQLRYLAENGYRTVNAADIAAYAKRQVRLGPGAVALCFDDAWASLWTVAAPLLRRFGLTGITYAIPARTPDAMGCRPTIEDGPVASGDEDRESGVCFASWPELQALHASGTVDIQCHTETHSMVFCSDDIRGFVTPAYARTPFLNRPQLPTGDGLKFLSPSDLGAPLYAARSRMSEGRRVGVSLALHERCVEFVAERGGREFFKRADWRTEIDRLTRGNRTDTVSIETTAEHATAIEAELDRGRGELQHRLRTRTVNHVCLPWGVSGPVTLAALKRLGYASAFANRLRGVHAVRPGDDPYWLKRLPNRYIFRLPGRARRIWS
jgi:hypothetical protein